MKLSSISKLVLGMLILSFNNHLVHSLPVPEINSEDYDESDFGPHDPNSNPIAHNNQNSLNLFATVPDSVTPGNEERPTLLENNQNQSMEEVISIRPTEADSPQPNVSNKGSEDSIQTNVFTLLPIPELEIPILDPLQAMSSKRSFDHSFNPFAHEDSRHRVALKLNELTLDLTNHMYQNTNYFNQIVTKFGKVDQAIKDLKQNIDEEKVSTLSRFSDVNLTIDQRDRANIQKQQELSNSIQKNGGSINKNENARKKERSQDQNEAKKMQDGINAQIAKAEKTMADTFDQLNKKLNELKPKTKLDTLNL